MNVQKLNCDVTEFIGIFHIADIHIRLTKRHDEYLDVFERLYEVVAKTPENTCVAILGDLFHSKSNLSPECVGIASDFLRRLADLRPTILIAGNHDATLTNKSRMDSLSPIVNAINHKNLFYLKDTGIYILGDIVFNHMSVFDPVESYIRATDIPKIYTNQARHVIALYHGAVHDAVSDVGYRINNQSVTANLFDGHDIVLLGDIHKYQTLEIPDSDTKIVYVGSLIQQNHGESLDSHGYVLWNLKQRIHKQFDIGNERGFYTIDIDKGHLKTDLSNLPKKVKLRVRCNDSDYLEIKAVIDEIRKRCEVEHLVYLKSASGTTPNSAAVSVEELSLADLNSVEHQNKLIKEYLMAHTSDKEVTDDMYETIFQINTQQNQLIDKDKLVRNIRWKPKKFEFSNMFSYGEDNVIDFTKMKDVIGLFASNASGKSSLMSALSFCIFDKCDRAFKATHILNSQKATFHCKFNFEIDNTDYFIERNGKSDKKGNVKVDVKFWKEENGSIIELNGEARRSTNDLIRDFVGSYEDFILTVLSIQNNKSGNFVDMGQSERKDLLSQFMGLNIFDILHSSASETLKELNNDVKLYHRYDNGVSIDDLSESIDGFKLDLVTLNEESDRLVGEKEKLNSSLFEETTKLIKIENNIPKNITSLESTRISVSTTIAKSESQIVTLQESLKLESIELENTKEELKSIDTDDVSQKFNQLKTLREQLQSIKHIIETKKIFITAKLDKINRLHNHQYDPNCKYCVNNSFVKDALDAESSLDNDKVEANDLVINYEDKKKHIESLVYVEELQRKCDLLKVKLNNCDRRIISINREITSLESTVQSNSVHLTKLDNDIKLYYDNESNIKYNLEVELKVGKIQQEIRNTDILIKQNNTKIINLSANLSGYEKNMQEKIVNRDKMKKTESDLKLYDLYVKSVSRDGIPFDLISKAVPVIESDVNEILSQIVDFSVNIETDGKNVVTNLVYSDKKWPLEMASGLEKFLTSLVIRVALINLSNLPRPNFIAIDEGFGCADSDNLSSMQSLFAILKSNFDFMLIISHLDMMKDMVDGQIEIKKEDGHSKIVY